MFKHYIHSLRRLDVKLPGSQEPQQSQSVQSLGVTQLLKLRPQLIHSSILLWGCVTRVAGLGLWGGCREIIVVILGGSGHGDGSGSERLLLLLCSGGRPDQRKNRESRISSEEKGVEREKKKRTERSVDGTDY